ncbi:ABC transporter ATP-binding protein [Leucobacter salsicius]|uniref:ABC transporter ATP-binding protein n=1 Tax=Leucobacter salsicius TaxID=664638 RepID=UPI00037D06A7|nr:ABC transporter ATP-binding protein [Leucobacter salsicius]
MAHLSLTGITKSFGDIKVLDNVTIEASDGEQLAILGPSGSGKSTLLRIIAGLEQPDSGSVLLDGVDQAGVPPHKRDTSIVFQHFALYPHLSAMKNITLGLKHGLGLSSAEADARASSLASRLQIEPLLSRKPREMSGGQRQRVALARALARSSGTVLLDEPLSGLDAQLHETLRMEIAGLLRDEGATGVNVTHDQLDAMAMADRIVVLNRGKIEQIGTPDELYSAPRTSFVASFVGSPAMNLLPLASDGSSAFEGVSFPAGTRLMLGVRAEELTLSKDMITSPWAVQGTVGLVEPAGPDRVVKIHTARNEDIAFRCSVAETPRLGERVTVFARPGSVLAFDLATGEAIPQQRITQILNGVGS